MARLTPHAAAVTTALTASTRAAVEPMRRPARPPTRRLNTPSVITAATMYEIEYARASPGMPSHANNGNASAMLIAFSTQLSKKGVRVSRSA